MSQDSRKTSRTTTKIEIVFKESRSFVRTYILNISNGGIFIGTETPLPLDAMVTLMVKLPGETDEMEIEGRVVWNNPQGRKNSFPKGMGIQFAKIDPNHAEKIQAFVDKHLKEIQHHSFM
jgi:uncharacterized protein (TIGR02266 family)